METELLIKVYLDLCVTYEFGYRDQIKPVLDGLRTLILLDPFLKEDVIPKLDAAFKGALNGWNWAEIERDMRQKQKQQPTN